MPDAARRLDELGLAVDQAENLTLGARAHAGAAADALGAVDQRVERRRLERLTTDGEALLAGQIVWLGKVNVDDEVSFRWGSLMGERHIVRSSYGGARAHVDFPALAEAYLRGDLHLDEMITGRIRLDDINEGFAALERGEAVRTIIEFG